MLSDDDFDRLSNVAYRNGQAYAVSHTYREEPLSGEWADDPTWRTVISELGLSPDDTDPSDVDALTDSWLSGFDTHWEERQ